MSKMVMMFGWASCPAERALIESGADLRVVLEIRHHDLDGDGALHETVVSAVDHAHRTLAETTEDAVAADRLGKVAGRRTLRIHATLRGIEPGWP
jgi:hypothetical protein